MHRNSKGDGVLRNGRNNPRVYGMKHGSGGHTAESKASSTFKQVGDNFAKFKADQGKTAEDREREMEMEKSQKAFHDLEEQRAKSERMANIMSSLAGPIDDDDDDDLNTSLGFLDNDEDQGPTEQEVIDQGKKKGWPRVLDEPKLKSFTKKQVGSLRDVLAGKEKSVFWDRAKENLEKKGKEVTQQVVFKNGWIPASGYYGKKGWAVVSEELERELGGEVENAMKSFEWMGKLNRSLLLFDMILIPEAMVRLIAHEQGCKKRNAEKVLAEGERYGNIMFRDRIVDSSGEESDYGDEFEEKERAEQKAREEKKKQKQESKKRKASELVVSDDDEPVLAKHPPLQSPQKKQAKLSFEKNKPKKQTFEVELDSDEKLPKEKIKDNDDQKKKFDDFINGMSSSDDSDSD